MYFENKAFPTVPPYLTVLGCFYYCYIIIITIIIINVELVLFVILYLGSPDLCDR